MIVKECLDCGKQSVPFFGMYGACGLNGGSHRRMVQIEQDDKVVAERLKNAYSCVPGFDQTNFNRNASPELKTLLYS